MGVSRAGGLRERDTAMALKACMLSIAAGMLLAACASGPRVMVLPGTGKTLEQFHADDAACREWVAQQTPPTDQWRSDMAYLQCMYAKGNRIPVTGGSQPAYMSPAPAAGAPPNVPPPPAGTPPPPPSGSSR
jgi:hypothetical protein